MRYKRAIYVNVCGKNVSLTPDFIEKFFLFTNFKTEKL